MPLYLAHRTVGEISDAELEAALSSAKEGADRMSGVRWIRSYYSAEEGKVSCEHEAPSLESLFGHARIAGVPLDSAAVVRDLEPSMFL